MSMPLLDWEKGCILFDHVMPDYSPVILIPAYEPTRQLCSLVERLCQLGTGEILVVNDGSGPAARSIFESLEEMPGVTVIHHGENLGKGQALKTGINHILVNMPDALGIVTADADGQHLPEDVGRVARALVGSPNALCLGVRQFGNKVPLRNRFGNLFTRQLFRLFSGRKVEDTQTGLRGMPIEFARKILHIDSVGYDFEFEALFEACRRGVEIVQVPIETVYDKTKSQSHFNPFIDSFKIYFVLLRFASSSLLVSLIDMISFSIFFYFEENLLASMVCGRICAGISQFFLSKHFVFSSRHNLFAELVKYVLLVTTLTIFSYNLIDWAVEGGLNVYLAKILVDTLLFFTSFTVQRFIVFNSKAG